MHDNHSDPGRRNGSGKGRNRQGRRRDEDERHSERHSEAGSGKGGRQERRENYRRAARDVPDYTEAPVAAGATQTLSQRDQRAQNRQRFLTGSGVPPPPPPPGARGPELRSEPRPAEPRSEPRSDPRDPRLSAAGQYAMPRGIEPVGERRPPQVQLNQLSQMPFAAAPVGQINSHMANLNISQALRRDEVGPRGATEDFVQSIREMCQGRNLSKAMEILQCVDDDKDKIWPVILEDILMTLREWPQKPVLMSCDDAAEIVYQLGRVQQPLRQESIQELSKMISEYAKYKTEDLSPFAISRMVWGFAQLCSRSDPLMSVVAAEVVKKIRSFKHEELANTAWAFAKCGLWNEQLANTLAAQCLEGIDEFTTESLANVAWAMAQWSSREERLLLKMSDALLQKPETYEPQHMATLSWAFSTLNFRPESLLKNILQEACRKMSQFSIKEVSHVAWAFANLRLQDAQLYTKIAEHIHHQQNLGMQPVEIANLAWAFAKNHLSNQVIMNRLAQEAVNQIGGFKAAEITMLTWAYAVSNLGHCALMLEIGNKVSQRSQKFTPGQLAHIIWAFGALSLKHEQLCDAVAKCCQQDMARAATGAATSLPSPVGAGAFGASSYNANALTQVVWGFAMVQYRNTAFLHEAASHICRGIDMLKPLSLWRCASAYNAMMVNSKEIKEAILVEACKKERDFSLKGLSRLLDCYNMHIGQKEHENLEKVMDGRLETVAERLSRLYPAAGNFPYEINNPDPATHQWLMDSGFLDLQAQGMKKILQKLKIETPSWAFVSKCLREAKPFWRSSAFAMLELTIGGQSHFVARSFENPDENHIKRLQMEVFQLNQPPMADCKVLCHVLELACKMLIDGYPNKHQQLGQVEGTVQILLSMVPSSNSMALLLQFIAKFPKLRLHFVEMQLNTSVLQSYLPV